ncbi:unnamed protein product [Urochloa humidicola]
MGLESWMRQCAAWLPASCSRGAQDERVGNGKIRCGGTGAGQGAASRGDAAGGFPQQPARGNAVGLPGGAASGKVQPPAEACQLVGRGLP